MPKPRSSSGCRARPSAWAAPRMFFPRTASPAPLRPCSRAFLPPPDFFSMPGSILIVEDSPTQALLLQNILERNGFEVAVARRGNQALHLLENARPFLVITDIQMPE